MSITSHTSTLLAMVAASAAFFFSTPVFATGAAAAQTLARQHGCFKCHAIDKKKEGSSFREVAAKYKGKAGAEARLYTHITTGEKAKFADGHEEDHKILKTKDEKEIKNLISWILAL